MILLIVFGCLIALGGLIWVMLSYGSGANERDFNQYEE